MSEWIYDKETDEYFYQGYKGPFDDIYLVLSLDTDSWIVYLYDEKHCRSIGDCVYLLANITDVEGAKKEALASLAENFPQQIKEQQRKMKEVERRRGDYERNIGLLNLFLKNIGS